MQILFFLKSPSIQLKIKLILLSSSQSTKSHFIYIGITPGVGDGQGGLVCCDSWGHKESDTTEATELN